MPKRSFFSYFTPVAFTFLVPMISWAAPSPDPKPVVRILGPGLILEIDPRIELLAGVQSWTTWTTDPQSDGYLGSPPRPYAQRLRTAMEPFRDDPAVKISQQLLQDRGFSYDAPPAFVLAGTNGLSLERPPGGDSDYLKERAGGSGILVSWGNALANLAARASFSSFFESQRPYYEGLLDQASRGLDAEPLARWLKDYYGSTGEFVFHFVLAPAMMPGGGSGTTVVRSDGGKTVTHVYQVIRDAQTASGAQLAGLTLHEFGHSFVNPAIGEQVPLLAWFGLERLWNPVKDTMKAMAYNRIETFLNELVLRAATIRGQRMVGLVTEDGVQRLLNTEVQRGFYPIKAVYRELADYEAHRDRWPRFHDFGPELLTRLSQQAHVLVRAFATNTGRVDSIAADFEGPDPAPGAPFTLSDGATSEGDGRASEVFFDRREPAGGKACLTLRGQAETTTWSFVGADLVPRKGTVVARFQVKGRNLKPEGRQFQNAYAGFLVEKTDGTKVSEVHNYRGTFGWKGDEVRAVLDPAAKSLRFGFFLSISGELSFDDVSVTWE